MANSASALGEKIVHVFEEAVRRNIMPTIEECGFSAKPEKMKNGGNNEYQVDLVVRDGNDNPVMLVETKYIRYKKHSRDKGRWLCVAHHNLKKSHPTIRKLTAILAGNWTQPSLALMNDFGIEAMRVPFQKFVGVLEKYDIEFKWPESDGDIPAKSLESFNSLSDGQKEEMGNELVEDIMEDLKQDVRKVLKSDLSIERRVSHVEVVLRTELNESIMHTFNSVPEAISELAKITSDRPMSSEDIGK